VFTSSWLWAQVPKLVEIQRIYFIGNHAFSDKELAQVLDIRGHSFFTNGSAYQEAVALRQSIKLMDFYKQAGYLRAFVKDSVAYTPEGKANLYFLIKEGRLFHINRIAFKGNEVIERRNLLELLNLFPGDPFEQNQLRQGLRSIVAEYEHRGYPLVIIVDSLRVTDSVSVTVHLHEGPRMRIGRIIIPELPTVSKKLIARELVIKPGDWYDSRMIQESQRRLFETNLFNGVQISPFNPDTTHHTVDLQVNLMVAKPRAFDLEFGLGQEREFPNADPQITMDLAGSWTNRNVWHSGRRIRILTTIKSLYPDIFIPQRLNLDFFWVEPWIFGFRIPTTLNPFYYYSTTATREYVNEKYGFRLISSYHWFRKLFLQTNLEWSTVRLEWVPQVSGETFQEERLITARFRWDTRNDLLSPSKGLLFMIQPRLVGGPLGGENSYLQLESSLSGYISLFHRGVLALRIGGGAAIVDSADADGRIPYDQRFLLGGNSSVRGYHHQELGPQYVDAGGESIPLGGNLKLLGNIEVRWPLYKLLGSEVFWDWGYLWPEINDFDAGDIQFGAGFGLTLETPIGPARLDLGFPWLKAKRRFGRSVIYLALAYAF